MRFAPLHRAIILLAALAAPAAGAAREAPPSETRLQFEEATAAAGIDFVHVTGRTPERHLPETMGAGVAWIDHDRDGDHDLYLVQSGPLPGTDAPDDARPPNVLYRNDGNGRFGRVASGADHRGYGMGVTAGDYDADGWPDLFVTNFGPDVLYRNNGDGTFSEVHAGVEDERWSASAAWGDLTGDGLLDLFVTHYVHYDPATAIRCGDEAAAGNAYCHIDLFDGVPDSLYRNLGDGTFEDVAEAAGVADALEGKGLGLVLADLDDDGDTDVYVANDTQQNYLYLSQGDGTFVDEGLFSGTGYSAEGKAQAGMGTDAADLDGDGIDEILVTNFAFEPNNLYRRFSPGAYLEESFALGLGEAGLAQLAFGIVAADLDADGDLEVVVANGHILDTVEAIQDGTPYAQRNHLFENRLDGLRAAAGVAPGDDWRPSGDLLREVSERAGSGFAPVEVSRGLAAGDADGDGLPELVFTNSGGPARLLVNRSAGGERVVLRLRGRAGVRDAYGATVVATPRLPDGGQGWPQHRELRSGSSYLSQNASDLVVGLGAARSVDLAIRWPDGSEQYIEGVEAGRLVLIEQGRDTPIERPLRALRP